MAKKKSVKKKGIDEKKELSDKEKKKEKTKQNRALAWILLFIGVFFVVLIVSFFAMKSSNHPKYKGMTFNIVQEGELKFYQTSFKVIYKGELTNYNIYLRNNPKELQRKVPFEGELNLRNNLVLSTTTENLFCDGDWSLAIANFLNLGIFNIEIIKDENATCSQSGEYMFVQIEEGEETRIEEYGPSCYKLIVSDCEILPVTERFMIEVFDKVNSMLEE